MREAGRLLYETGIATDGRPVRAKGAGGTGWAGADAACVRCHRRSGEGGTEGGVLVPPVTGPRLFRPAVPASGRLARGMRFAAAAVELRPAYDVVSLRRALTMGVTPAGKPLSQLMPRYSLSRADSTAIETYLRHLGRERPPGVDAQGVHWAVVSTPTVPVELRQVQRDVLRRCASERFPGGRPGAWVLHDWDLSGPPADWARQLGELQRRRPVLALLSGTGTTDWGPVHGFCESSGVPCLFPEVDHPGDRMQGRESFYFSGGVWLEAAILAEQLAAQGGAPTAAPRKVRQWVAADIPAARAGAEELQRRLSDRGVVASLAPVDAATLAVRLAQTAPSLDEEWVLWLEPAALRAFFAQWPDGPPSPRVWISGWIAPAHLAQTPVPPPAWRATTAWVHPFDAAARLALRMRYNLQPWLRQHGLADDPALHRIQGNALAACMLAAEAVAAMRGRPTGQQLVEQIENYPAAMGNAPAAQAFHVFNLAPGRRISSPGAFLVRWNDADPPALEPLGEWHVAEPE